MLYPKSFIFADGENLVLRYQAMVKDGAKPKSNVVHRKDIYVWSPEVTLVSHWALNRVSYYSSFVGDEPRFQSVAQEIAEIPFNYHFGQGYLNPHLFKKQKRGEKTKSVDINLVTDLLRHTYNKSLEVAFILSGDGDYLPTIKDVMRQGSQVWVGAFSSGLDQRLKREVDEFYDLDKLFFEP